MTPIGRPSGEVCSGRLTAGCPVTLNSAVKGVNRFCRSKHSAGSAPSVNQPTGTGGSASVGSSSTSYAAVATMPARLAACTAASAPVNCTADIARPRSRSQRVSGRAAPRPPGATGSPAAVTDQSTSKDGSSSGPYGRSMSSTSWPSSSSSAEAASYASTTCGCTTAPSTGGVRLRPTRSRPGGRSQADRKLCAGGGAQCGSPGIGPARTSSRAAVSRTVRAIGPFQARPVRSPRTGPPLTRPRATLSPTRPLTLPGMRSEPPPSEPCASGSSPAATAAPAPPLLPPAERDRSQGLRVGGPTSVSV